MSNTPKVEPGKILIAEPFMMDTNFKRAVVCMCEHSPTDGSIGFILNKPINMDLSELVSDIESDEDYDVYYGGPVSTDTLHYMHNVGELLEDSIKIGQGVYWGGDFDKLKFLINSGMIRRDNIRFYIGYSGWSPRQLDDELILGSWVVSEIHANYVFKTKSSTLWRQAMINKGDRYSVIAQMPNYLSHN